MRKRERRVLLLTLSGPGYVVRGGRVEKHGKQRRLFPFVTYAAVSSTADRQPALVTRAAVMRFADVKCATVRPATYDRCHTPGAGEH